MFLRILLAIFAGGGVLRASTPEESASTVVVYNVNSPDGKGLADFYCQARGIDPSRQIPLSLIHI